MNRMIGTLVLFLPIVLSSRAATIRVPGEYLTIAEAVRDASDGDTILVGPGVYDAIPTIYARPNGITLLGNGYSGSDRTILEGDLITEFEAKLDLRHINGWEIGGFELKNGRKGVNIENCEDMYLHDLYIHDLSWFYADGIMLNGVQIRVERCIIEKCPYAGIEIWNPVQSGHVFRNNTIVDCENGLLMRGQTPDLVLENNIIVFNGDGVEYAGSWTGTELLTYNNVYGNYDYDWYGCTPGANNLSVDPLFDSGQGVKKYWLHPASPCVDSGNPYSPLDADGTRADIGCFFFRQKPEGNLSISFKLKDSPIALPLERWGFYLSTIVASGRQGWSTFDDWFSLVTPDGQVFQPLALECDCCLLENRFKDKSYFLCLNSCCPSGIYHLEKHVGIYPDIRYASEVLEFVKPTDSMNTDQFASGFISDGNQEFSFSIEKTTDTRSNK